MRSLSNPRVASCKLRVACCELRVACCELRVTKFTLAIHHVIIVLTRASAQRARIPPAGAIKIMYQNNMSMTLTFKI